MTRIPLVGDRQAGWLTRMAFRIARRRYGEVPEPVRAAAHHPRLMWAAALHEMAYEKAVGRLDTTLRDLVVHRVATRVGCSWCVDFGTMLTLKAGLSVERHRELARYQTSDATDLLDQPGEHAGPHQPRFRAALLASAIAGKCGRVTLVSRYRCDACELVIQGWRWGSILGPRFVAMAGSRREHVCQLSPFP